MRYACFNELLIFTLIINDSMPHSRTGKQCELTRDNNTAGETLASIFANIPYKVVKDFCLEFANYI